MTTELDLPGDMATLYRLQVRGIRDYAMFLMDPGGTVLTWNEGVEQLLGYAEGEFLGNDGLMIFTPEDRAARVPAMEMQRAREEGQAANIRWHQRKNGSRLYTHGVLQALRTEEGNLIGYAKVISDETRQKHLEDALTESNAALSQFSHAVAHDLQEPARAVRAYAELLERRCGPLLPQEAKQILTHLQEGAVRMQQLVRDLLTWSHLASEDEPACSVSLNEDLESACSQLHLTIEENKATVTHDPLPTLNVNRGQMVRLFLNLLSNAIKYRNPDEPPVIHVSAVRDDGWWTIAVRDNGIGFDQKYADEIFEFSDGFTAASTRVLDWDSLWRNASLNATADAYGQNQSLAAVQCFTSGYLQQWRDRYAFRTFARFHTVPGTPRSQGPASTLSRVLVHRTGFGQRIRSKQSPVVRSPAGGG